MTINKKSSRSILIDIESYNWTISPDSGYIVFVAEHAQIKGRRIEVYITSEVNSYWTNFPKVNEMNIKVIKPHDVKNIINQALIKGWDPKVKGKPMVFDLEGEFIIKR
ncbi:hypothetical protein [Paenibacillus radicis (ex Xue et al. 2023)]|uniref:Uncharacterized protein n=1 Tax=Paenibacillus radicis (ex Xue et al. 2023) TaxID=2972489 RepID=A0ABT1YQM8_9BACL|nr:hypothetical protein [Paenibacillus radicis (ex Xue et al. 2023)]MCR8635337.1 hypothetical protein [Paenibacillus radicis (ex Xue et al. 2023)]